MVIKPHGKLLVGARKKERVLQELVVGVELTKEVTRTHTEGILVMEEAQLSRSELDTTLSGTFGASTGSGRTTANSGGNLGPTRLGFTAQESQSDCQDWINKVGLKKKKQTSRFTLMHLGIKEHLWSDVRAHQLERGDISPSQSRDKTPNKR